MWNLDSYTLATVSSIALLLSSVLLFIEALSKDQFNTLIWVASSLLLGSIGMATLFLRLTNVEGIWIIPTYNSLSLITHAFFWTSIRRFKRLPAKLPWIFAGAGLWLLLSLFPWFNTNDGIRIVFFSVIAGAYTVLLLIELWPLIRPYKSAQFLLTISVIHIIFYSYRLLTVTLDNTAWIQRPDLTLILLELPAFTICTAFGISALTKTQLASHFRNISFTDELTEIPNRRAYIIDGQNLWDQAKNNKSNLIMIECDIDNFKDINDIQGHIVGDQVLKLVAKKLHQSVRNIDLCARIGGEEFIIMAPGLDLNYSEHLASRLLDQVRSIKHEKLAQVTISIGITEIHPDDTRLEDTFDRADKALYRAKLFGKDRYVIWQD